MTKGYRILRDENPEQAAWGIIGRGIRSYNVEQAGDHCFQRLCFVLQDASQQIVGGVLGEIHWNWLYVDLLWVKSELRGLGFGGRLLSLLEQAAREAGAEHAHLDTFSFQAPDFYKKHGYRVFGELQDFPPGHQRYYLTKRL